MKRVNNLYPILISDENIAKAISDVNSTHKFLHGKPNRTVLWVEITKEERIKELREIIENGFVPSPSRHIRRYDHSAGKWRDIYEPKLWPDQYIHHMVVQVFQPIMMRGMDYWCCGSIKRRGTQRGIRGIRRWMDNDLKNTKYVLECDIYHFYESLQPEVVMARMRQLVKDEKVLDVLYRLVSGGILIGAYFSQWVANTVLQPLDHLIREQLHIPHYVRYMDNLTLFSRNKKDLHKAVNAIEEWLKTINLHLKGNWQVYSTVFRRTTSIKRIGMTEEQRRRRHPRMVNAMGYMFAHGYVLVRKKNLLRLKRQLSRTYRRLELGQPIGFRTAAGLISRIGQLTHCCSRNIWVKYIKPGLLKQLKDIVRTEMRRRKEVKEWEFNTCLAQLKSEIANKTSSESKV